MKLSFAIATLLVATTSAVHLNKKAHHMPAVMPVLTDQGFVLMQTDAAQKLHCKNRAKAGGFNYDKPSEYLCDGDAADDKEIQDAADPNDPIVEDFGFSGSRNARGQVRF